jgi:hypothetical protein
MALIGMRQRLGWKNWLESTGLMDQPCGKIGNIPVYIYTCICICIHVYVFVFVCACVCVTFFSDVRLLL